MSGKQSKRRRRELRLEKAGPVPRRQASTKVLAIAAALVALAGVGIGIAVGVRGGSSSATNVPARGSLAGALPGAVDVQELFAGIVQRENVLGAASAPVTLVEYADLQCPYCREFDTQALPDLVTRFVRTGQLKIELRPLAFLGPDSVRGRAALIAAGKQSRLFHFLHLVYLNQGPENTGWLSEELVQEAAASIPGLDVPRLLDARNDDAVINRASAFDVEAQTAGVSSTPTIYVGRSGGTLHEVELTSATDSTGISAAVQRLLRPA
jgi:protein-disulfide isomerase